MIRLTNFHNFILIFYVNQNHVWDPNIYKMIRIFSKRTMTSQEKNPKELNQTQLWVDQMNYGGIYGEQ